MQKKTKKQNKIFMIWVSVITGSNVELLISVPFKGLSGYKHPTGILGGPVFGSNKGLIVFPTV